MIFFCVQKWKPIERNHSISNATLAEPLANCFRDPNNNLNVSMESTKLQCQAHHCWQNVRQSACKFEHDNNDGYCNVHNATQCGTGAEEGVCSWSYAWYVWRTS